jgi:hypothetical protein
MDEPFAALDARTREVSPGQVKQSVTIDIERPRQLAVKRASSTRTSSGI